MKKAILSSILIIGISLFALSCSESSSDDSSSTASSTFTPVADHETWSITGSFTANGKEVTLTYPTQNATLKTNYSYGGDDTIGYGVTSGSGEGAISLTSTPKYYSDTKWGINSILMPT